jgi:hypothetical protein
VIKKEIEDKKGITMISKKSITQSKYPVVKLLDWCFFLLDEELSKEGIPKTVYKFYEKHQDTLKCDIKHDIPQVLKEIEVFRSYKVELLKTLKSDKPVSALVDMAYNLSKRGHSKVRSTISSQRFILMCSTNMMLEIQNLMNIMLT